MRIQTLTTTLCLSLPFTLCGPPQLYAQADADRRKVALTKYLEATKLKRWQRVEQLYEQHIQAELANFKDPQTLTLRYAQALVHQLPKTPKTAPSSNQLRKADKALRAVLEAQPAHPQAVTLLAKLCVLKDTKASQAEARDHLLHAARLGVPVLNQLQQQQAQLYKQLLNEPAFILKLMRAPSQTKLSKPRRDFFRPPYRQPKARPLSREQQRQAKFNSDFAALKTFMDKFKKRLQDGQYDGALELFKHLNTSIQALRAQASSEQLKALERWLESRQKGTLDRLERALQLQLLVNQAKVQLQAFKAAADEQKWAELITLGQELKDLAKAMEALGGDEARDRAEELSARVEPVTQKAKRWLRIKSLDLTVQGLLIDQPNRVQQGLKGPRVIINDRIYSLGEQVHDHEDQVIPGLTVVAITRSGVRLQYQGLQFHRGLNRPELNKKPLNKRP